MKEYTVAFVGNPNVGKSAWINALSNAKFKVGNWPGVTVEKKEACVKWVDDSYHFIDLPGCYCLEDIGNEERITTAYLRQEKVDLIVNVLDVTNLSRNLYLTLLLRELQIPMLLIFNFMDVAEKRHMHIEAEKISRRLQIPILCVSAFQAKDAKLVQQKIMEQIHQDGFYFPLLCNEDVERYVAVYHYLEAQLPAYLSMEEQALHCLTLQIVKEDESALRQVVSWGIDQSKLMELKGDCNAERIDQNRYTIISSLMHYVREDSKEDSVSRKIDALLLHKVMGLPIFFCLFTCLLLFVFQASAPFNSFIEFFINDILRKYLAALTSLCPPAIQALLLDGILAGVGGVLTFVPLMALLYFMLSLLEESGYMNRIAFLLDRMMHCFHLSGKSFVALLLGFGCNVPAIYAARTLDNEKQKRLTAFLVPFMSCGARLPVYVLFASAFFPHKAPVMIITVYGIGILMALIMALLLSRSSSFKEEGIFVLELPSYHLPKLKIVFHKVKEEVKAYVKKACSIVLWAMVILWGISYFPNGNVQDSYMAHVAKKSAFLFEPAGFGTRWECVASLPGGILAKETIIGYFNSMLNGETIERGSETLDWKQDMISVKDNFLSACKESVLSTIHPEMKLKSEEDVHQIRSLWTDEKANLRAFCFMVYVLLSMPCIMTLQALYREYGGRLLLLSMISMLVLPYLISVGIFQLFSIF